MNSASKGYIATEALKLHLIIDKWLQTDFIAEKAKWYI